MDIQVGLRLKKNINNEAFHAFLWKIIFRNVSEFFALFSGGIFLTPLKWDRIILFELPILYILTSSFLKIVLNECEKEY